MFMHHKGVEGHLQHTHPHVLGSTVGSELFVPNWQPVFVHLFPKPPALPSTTMPHVACFLSGTAGGAGSALPLPLSVNKKWRTLDGQDGGGNKPTSIIFDDLPTLPYLEFNPQDVIVQHNPTKSGLQLSRPPPMMCTPALDRMPPASILYDKFAWAIKQLEKAE